MLIKVKREHIDKGYTLDECFCPVKRAIKEAVPSIHGEFNLGLSRGGFDTDTGYVHFELSRIAYNFISAFDALGSVYGAEIPAEKLAELPEFEFDIPELD